MQEFQHLQNCTLCPQACGAGRVGGEYGYCGAGAGFEIASIIVHNGEEPVISGIDGICNVFFSGCNLQCLYCQNHQISRNTGRLSAPIRSLSETICRITGILERGIKSVGFVSPSHVVPQVKIIIQELHRLGHFPRIVYNTNAYERVDILRTLEGLVDVYLPDCKYSDSILAARWSSAPDYPKVAQKAIKEMYRQKGNRLLLDDQGILQSGMIVRHLVLPGAVANSIGVFRFLADQLSNRVAVSLMSQYRPISDVMDQPPLNRKVSQEEYKQVVRVVEELCFESGWLQEYESADCYNPDFTQTSPFKE
jgi:putative pyruvate formate lyase activating enzyme